MPGLYDHHGKFETVLYPYPVKPSQNDAGKTVIVRPTEQSAREYAIAIARVNLLRERLEHCVQKEGVNHHHLCTEERDAYIEWIQKKNNGQLKPS